MTSSVGDKDSVNVIGEATMTSPEPFARSDSTERWRAGPTPGEASEDFTWRRVVSLNGVDFHTDVIMLAALMSRRS